MLPPDAVAGGVATGAEIEAVACELDAGGGAALAEEAAGGADGAEGAEGSEGGGDSGVGKAAKGGDSGPHGLPEPHVVTAEEAAARTYSIEDVVRAIPVCVACRRALCHLSLARSPPGLAAAGDQGGDAAK